ncbi:MAG: 2-octaprenyl-3-methyl-6-methoxy-1,4-benzoquinol hydroxylase [Herbaspirillum frisingense]|uniref:2-octaprenyl-3-methyl-6-methoxy-1,4-benzoquinol hydroxylase n=1 Tax=Herbaspirillum frisingense TaxID=92645 RepID=A0A7V8JVK0_9BURK|nr:MAG: 2-octaprenyl-3-methyl-6-methoxy-1,4-benzoquinol hydroxylase [Herbaspirillum frisingense]
MRSMTSNAQHSSSSPAAAGSDICIVGDGAVGKTAALGLAQAGFKVTLLAPPAKAAAPDEASWDVRVYALNHTAHRLLSSVRVWEAMDAERIAPVDNMTVHGDGMAEKAQPGLLSFDSYAARTNALAWIVEDRNLDNALNAALRFAPNVRVVQGRATALAASLDAATLTLESGETLSASLVVGADGAQSWVRGQCDIGMDYRSYGQHAIVTNFTCEKPHLGVAYQWFSPTEGVIALLPLPGNRVSLVWSAPQALADQLLRLPLSELANRLGQWATPVLGALAPVQPEVVKAFPLRLIKPHAMIAQRVALIGDAAHVVHPMAGHGMNLGFGDVAALIETLVQREQQYDCGDSRVLRRYARARKEEVLLMQIATDGLNRIFSTEAEPVRIARNLGMNLVNRLPVLKRRLIAHALGK